MLRSGDNEFHFTPEARFTDNEFTAPPEEFGSSARAGKVSEQEAQARRAASRHNLIKKLVLMPAAGVAAVVILTMAAFNMDPLGQNALAANSAATATATPAPGTTPAPGVTPAPGETPGPAATPTPAPMGENEVTNIKLSVTYTPTGETYVTSAVDDAAMAEARSWVASVGGDPDTMVFVRSETVYAGWEASDDAIIVGDTDCPLENLYIAQGTIIKKYIRYDYYEAYATVLPDPYSVDAFPTLENLNPDFAGDYAWSGEGTEEYIRFARSGDKRYTYLQMGSVWGTYGITLEDGTFSPNTEGTDANARYDKETNVLTLENFNALALDTNLMGNGFTINLIGENHIQYITCWGAMYGGSVTFTGDGSLYVNENRSYNYGITLNAENSTSCIMVDRNAYVEVQGSEMAILVADSFADQCVYYLKPQRLSGGAPAKGVFDENNNFIPGAAEPNIYTLVDESGEPSKHVCFTPDTTFSLEHADLAVPNLVNKEPNGTANVTAYNYDTGTVDTIESAVQDTQYVVLDGVALVKGSGITGAFAPEGTVEGAFYDEATNTLTIRDYTGGTLSTNLMGNGFTLRVLGDCHLDNIEMYGYYYGGSLTVSGDGSLTVNESNASEKGILLDGQCSATALMVDKDVTLDVYGSDAAVMVYATRLSKSIYYLSPQKLSGGLRTNGKYGAYSINTIGTPPSGDAADTTALYNDSTVLGSDVYGDGSLGYVAELYNDCTVLGSDGKPATHVTFTPAEQP